VEIVFKPAAAADAETLLPLVREFYDFEHLAFDEGDAREALRQILADARLGRIWLIRSGSEAVGYLVLTFGFSLEFKGRDAFVDELFLRAEFRGQGLGTRALQVAEEACRAEGVRALHLEVDHANTAAQEVYRRFGFKDHDRYLLTKWIEPRTN
jgi:ribosomal protein S18 acetylase RimI-like enzyme